MERNREEIEIDLREIWGVLKKRALAIVLVALIAALIAGAVSFFVITPQYSSTARLYILTQSTSITSLADIQAGTSLASDYLELIKSRPVVEKVIKDLNLKDSYQEMLDRMTVANPENTRILNITIEDPDAAVAKEIANDFALVSQKQISEIMKTDEPTIAEKAVIAETPTKPDKKKDIAIGFLIGLLGSALFFIIRYITNDSIRSQEDIEKYLGLNTLAVFSLDDTADEKSGYGYGYGYGHAPKKEDQSDDKKIEFEDLKRQNYSIREGCNSLRTNLRFCGDSLKVFMITSTIPNEGKSSLAFEMARSFAEEGRKTLMIDADMRKSVIASKRKIKCDEEIKGLSHCLSGQEELEDCIYATNVDNMDIVEAGPVTPNPTETLGSPVFSGLIKRVREMYDVIILDTPPVGTVIDAAVIAPNTDGAVFVIRDSWVSYRKVQEAIKQVNVTGCRILGTMLNKSSDSKYYSKYKNKKYYGHY